MEFIRSIDIFGAQFNFTIFGKSNYNTSFGGFLTLFIVIATIVISIMFGLDLVLRTNPKVLIDRINPPNYSYINASVQNFPIFWNIVDDNNLPINFTNILFPELNFYVFKFNKTTGVYDLVDTKPLQAKQITRKILKNDIVYDHYDLDSFYCLDWKDSSYPFGGSWDGIDMVYYFEMVFYSCPNDNKTSPNCTKPRF